MKNNKLKYVLYFNILLKIRPPTLLYYVYSIILKFKAVYKNIFEIIFIQSVWMILIGEDLLVSWILKFESMKPSFKVDAGVLLYLRTYTFFQLDNFRNDNYWFIYSLLSECTGILLTSTLFLQFCTICIAFYYVLLWVVAVLSLRYRMSFACNDCSFILGVDKLRLFIF